MFDLFVYDDPHLENDLVLESEDYAFWTIWTFDGWCLVMMDQFFGFTLTVKEH